MCFSRSRESGGLEHITEAKNEDLIALHYLRPSVEQFPARCLGYTPGKTGREDLYSSFTVVETEFPGCETFLIPDPLCHCASQVYTFGFF